MKLKNIATVGLIIALFFIVAALFINFDLVPNINSFTKVCLQTFFYRYTMVPHIKRSLDAIT